MRSSLIWAIAVVAFATNGTATAQSARKIVTPVKPATLQPAPAPVPARVRGVALVPLATAMRAMTPREAEANAIWNLRAGLNVAALQCQFSPFLATVRTYNDFLRHHSAELAAAQATLQAHFRRYDGAKAINSFDSYTTKTYNSYSTLDAQYSFCAAAADVGRGALMIAKGGFGGYALAQGPVLRASLTPGPTSATLLLVDAVPVALPAID